MSVGVALFLLSPEPIPKTLNLRLYSPSPSRRLQLSPVCVSYSTLPFAKDRASDAGDVRRMLEDFDPTIPLPEALTPPSSWYTDPSFFALEFERVFFRGWQVVGYIEQVKSPNDFFTGRLGNVEFVVCRDASGELHAFHNVCRHHASILASGSGQRSCFECPYHVFCDNYLDGGYHVVYAHGGLASGLKLDSYTTRIYEKVSIQSCESAPAESNDLDRLGSKALYAFVYPNFMINRYGPWMDTNLALPLGPNKCQVIFDYFLDSSMLSDEEFIERSLKESETVQMEDIALCEGVQKGLESPAYCSGRTISICTTLALSLFLTFTLAQVNTDSYDKLAELGLNNFVNEVSNRTGGTPLHINEFVTRDNNNLNGGEAEVVDQKLIKGLKNFNVRKELISTKPKYNSLKPHESDNNSSFAK
ncbi:Choline monooxygenase, chloroplastic [Dendrobium catenatum]|uniref:Choline monooxygenase, chloroplastic n=1 Tax=Dendrobium catenatum TaxID=906689 RepID=A0A2I0WJZ5_9ASPA|nr:Choline monooxygenase, chloroplastic [Dendrobium catenatum]